MFYGGKKTASCPTLYSYHKKQGQIVKEDYQPMVNEEIIAPLGHMTTENTYILSTVTVPKKVEDFSINLKAPIVINMDTNKGAQIITEDDFPVKFKIYDLLMGKTEKAGE